MATTTAPVMAPTPAVTTKELTFASWTESQLGLLQIEQQEGVAKHESSSKKLSVNKLQLNEVRIGSFGKTTLVLTRDKPIPPGALSSGSPVRITCPRWGTEEDSANERRGIVKSCEENRIEVICKSGRDQSNDNKLQASHEHDVTVESLPDEITIKRINKALVQAASTRWAQLLFGDMSPRFRQETLDFFKKHPTLMTALNESQREAVSLVSRALDIAVIHGPPGTGKTTTLVKAIETILTDNPNARILCCAPSNVAVDNLVSLLGRKKFRLVRLGHPSRVNPLLQEHTLDAILATSDMAELVKDAKKELLQTRDFMRKRELRKEIKQREQSFIRSVIKDSQIVLSTISSSADVGKFAPDGFAFTHLIVDEAAQAMESSVWIPLQYLDPASGVLILAGDHKQLPPTILSDQAARQGLGFTMMERVIKKHKESAVILSTQYRMNNDIMAWSSQEMYGGVLKAHESVSQQRLRDLLTTASDTDEYDEDELLDPLVFIDTSGCGLNEQELQHDEESRCNPGEVELIVIHVMRLLSSANLAPEQIAVVTPYRAQVEAIRMRLAENAATEKVEVRTVDGFQGQEREAIVLSMVRSNPQRNVGFLGDERRLNVAVTRAKRQVCMIGDALTLESNPFLKRLTKYFYDNGTVRSAAEFVQTFGSASEGVSAAKAKQKKDKTLATKRDAVDRKPSASVSSLLSKSLPTPVPVTAKKSLPSHVKTTSTIKLATVSNDDKLTPKFAALAVDDDDEEEDAEEVELKAAPKEEVRSEQDTPKSDKKRPNKKGKKKAAAKDAQQREEEDEGDEDWAFLEEAAKQANRCSFSQCDAYVELVGKNCQFCKQRFCLAHCLEEKHGCGAAARKNARENIGKKAGLKVAERARLQQRLDDKIKKEEKNRAAVVPQKGGSKKQ